MPRIRTIKPDFFADEKLSKLKREYRLFYIGLWVFADDYGTIRSNSALLKSNVFPYDEDLRVSDIKNALDALVKARMLEPFEYNGEGFYNIRTFDVHQKVEKKSRPLVPLAVKTNVLKESVNSRGVVPDYSVPEVVHSTEELGLSNIVPKGTPEPGGSVAHPRGKKNTEKELEKQYGEIQKTFPEKDRKEIYEELKKFVSDHRPPFLEPYIDAWNLITEKLGLAQVKQPTSKRAQKIRIRAREPAFDFFEIMAAVRKNKFYLGDGREGSWKVDFDHVIESETNYIKILERK